MKRKNKGFTLIEIIVVLVIIAILAVITIPVVMGYVEDAEDTKIINKAHNALTVTKSESVWLLARGELLTKVNDASWHQEVMEKAEVEGELISIKLNESQTSTGDFVVKIDGKYVSFNDAKQEFTLSKNLSDINIHEQVRNELLSSSFTGKINDYFNRNSHPERLDSEGPNTGSELLKIFKEKGYDLNNFSFRIYKKYGGSSNTITISNQRITLDMVGSSIDVIQYDYGDSTDFSSTPVVKKATVPIISKTEKDTQNNEVTYAVFDLSNVEWTIE